MKINFRLKHNLLVLIIYSAVVYVLLLPLKLWVVSIGISFIMGWVIGILNDILTQLRRMNGEKFPELDAEIIARNKKVADRVDKPDELLKS